jgi:hypothetical protein
MPVLPAALRPASLPLTAALPATAPPAAAGTLALPPVDVFGLPCDPSVQPITQTTSKDPISDVCGIFKRQCAM